MRASNRSENRVRHSSSLCTTSKIIGQSTSNPAADQETFILFARGKHTAPTLPQPTITQDQVTQLHNPYRGLLSFSTEDSSVFYGRSTLINEMVELLRQPLPDSQFLAVVGPSGSGKSSVVKAGLIPAVLGGRLPEASPWSILQFTPNRHPWEEFASAIQTSIPETTSLTASMLESSEAGIRPILTNLGINPRAPWFIVIDQFEELFTLVEDETTRQAFLDFLIATVVDPAANVKVVITLRADFVDRPLQYADFGDLLRHRIVLVLPLTPVELTEAITKPVEQLGMTIAADLVAQLIQDVGGQPGMLPLLQFALTELFDQRSSPTLTLSHYQKTGGVKGALASRADELYDQLTPEQQVAARQLFLRLITLGEGVEDTRRRVRLREIISLKGNIETKVFANNPELLDLPQLFGRFRLLTFDRDPLSQQPTVEVAHEALIREWPRLRQWIYASRDDLRRQRELDQAARQWLENSRDESYLLHGSRLAALEEWQHTTSVALTEEELAFLAASFEARAKQQAAEAARQQKELETAQKLAEEQRQRAEEQTTAAKTLRQRAYYLAVAGGFVAILAIVATLFARSSQQNAAIAAAQEMEAREAYSLSLAANAREILDADNQSLALLLATAANTIENPPESSWQTLIDVAFAPGVNRLYQYEKPIADLAMFPDQQTFVTASDDGLILVWDRSSGDIKLSLDEHSGGATAVDISPDGRYIVSGGKDDRVLLWDAETGELIRQLLGHQGDVSEVKFISHGQQIVSSENNKAAPSDLIIWDVESGEVVNRFGANGLNREGIIDMDVSATGDLAIVGMNSFFVTNDQPAVVWNISDGVPLFQFEELKRAVTGVSMSNSGSIALVAGQDNNIYRWNMNNGQQNQPLIGHTGPVMKVAISPNEETALSFSLDRSLIWWDLRSGQIIDRFMLDDSEVIHIEFIGSDRAVTASVDGTIRLWNLTSNWLIERWGNNQQSTDLVNGEGLAISPDGTIAVSSNQDPNSSFTVWDYETGQSLKQLGNGAAVTEITFSPDGKQFIASSYDGTVTLYDVESEETRPMGMRHGGNVTSVSISSDGLYALSSSVTAEVIYWDLLTGEAIHILNGHFHPSGVLDVAFLPGDQHGISSSRDGSLIIWDLQKGEQLQRLTGLETPIGSHFEPSGDKSIHDIELSPHGDIFLTTGWDETILVWDLARGMPVQRLVGHDSIIIQSAFSPDGRSVLSAAQNDDVIFWDISTGTIKRRIPINDQLNSQFLPAIAIHPDGETALVTDADGTIMKIRLTEPNLAEIQSWLSTNRYFRQPSCAERDTYGIEPLCQDGIPSAVALDLISELNTPQIQAVEELTPLLAYEPSFEVAGQPRGLISLGTHEGELQQQQFDIWTYEGQAGDILQVEMIAENPVEDPNAPDLERIRPGRLDTILFVIDPHGQTLSRVDFDLVDSESNSSNARIQAVVLPEDGLYRIEARSFLDEGAGKYTLKLESRNYEIDPEILEDYVGEYIEGPWEGYITYYVEDGNFYAFYEGASIVYHLFPVSDVEFVDFEGSRVVFNRQKDGTVVDYKIWLSPANPIGPQWYSGKRR